VRPVSPLASSVVAITRVGPAAPPLIVSDEPLHEPYADCATANVASSVTSTRSPSADTNVAVYGCTIAALSTISTTRSAGSTSMCAPGVSSRDAGPHANKQTISKSGFLIMRGTLTNPPGGRVDNRHYRAVTIGHSRSRRP